MMLRSKTVFDQNLARRVPMEDALVVAINISWHTHRKFQLNIIKSVITGKWKVIFLVSNVDWIVPWSWTARPFRHGNGLLSVSILSMCRPSDHGSILNFFSETLVVQDAHVHDQHLIFHIDIQKLKCSFQKKRIVFYACVNQATSIHPHLEEFAGYEILCI